MRIAAAGWGINTIRREEGYVVFDYSNRRRIEQLAAESGRRLRVVDERSAYLPLEKGVKDFKEIMAAIKSLLQPDGGARL